MNKGIIAAIGILMIFLAGFANQVSAYAVGASPATLSFNISRGGYEEKTFQVSTNSETPLEFSLSVTDSVSSMIKLETKDKTTVSGKPGEILVKVAIPRSAKPANLDGAITAILKPSGSAPDGSGSIISTGVAVRVKIEITGETASLFKSKTFLAGTGLIAVLFIFGLTYLFRVARKSKKPKKTQKKRKRTKSRK
jgi:hypothetical protein